MHGRKQISRPHGGKIVSQTVVSGTNARLNRATMQIVPAAPCANALGEGPIWSIAEGRLYWLDIAGKQLQWLEPSNGSQGLWELHCRASAIAERTSGGFLLGTERGFAIFEPATGNMQFVHNPEPERD